jgi:DNA polymerase-1
MSGFEKFDPIAYLQKSDEELSPLSPAQKSEKTPRTRLDDKEELRRDEKSENALAALAALATGKSQKTLTMGSDTEEHDGVNEHFYAEEEQVGEKEVGKERPGEEQFDDEHASAEKRQLPPAKVANAAKADGGIAEPALPIAEPEREAPLGLIQAGPAPVAYRLITEHEKAARALGELSDSYLVGLDTETTGLDLIRDRVRLVQIAVGSGEPVLLIDCFRVPLDGLKEQLGRLRVIAHNAVFDWGMLATAKVRLQQSPECTQLLNHSFTGEMESLATLAQRHLGIVLPKELQHADWSGELTEEKLQYAARDAAPLLPLARQLRSEAENRGALRVYELMRGAQAAVVKMELTGISFDADRHRLLLLEAGRAQNTALWELRRLKLSRPSSVQATVAWLERFGVDGSWPRTKKGQLRTDAATLRYLAHSLTTEGREAVERLLQFRDSTKLLSTYGTKFAGHVHPDTGRIHAEFLLAGTRTGRMSCQRPNLQQIPRDPAFRACFRAPEGRSMVVADYNQIELRVAAILTREPRLLEAYRSGVDVHRETAARLLKKGVEDVTKDERQLAKAVNFGLLYGQGPGGLTRYAAAEFDVHLPVAEARRLRNAWFAAYPFLRTWQGRQVEEGRRLGQVRTPAGRVRSLVDDSSPALAALNTPISGGAAEVMLAALGRLPQALEGLDAVPVLVVHDELVLEVSREDAEEASRRLTALMREAFLEIFPDGPTAGLVEAGIGRTWSEAKK